MKWLRAIDPIDVFANSDFTCVKQSISDMKRYVDVIYQNNLSISWWSNASFMMISIQVQYLLISWGFFYVNVNQLVIAPTVFVSPEFMILLFLKWCSFFGEHLEDNRTLMCLVLRICPFNATFYYILHWSALNFLVECKLYKKLW